MENIKKQFRINITVAGEKVSETFELDNNVVFVNGLVVTSDRDDLLYARGSQKIEINSKEVLPDDYESKLVMSGISVSPNEKYYKINKLDSGNKIVKITYQDAESTLAVFIPYRVSLYLDLEIK